jgi:hypothetical protein
VNVGFGVFFFSGFTLSLVYSVLSCVTRSSQRSFTDTRVIWPVPPMMICVFGFLFDVRSI